MNAACPPTADLDGLLDGRLPAVQERALEQHLADCGACRDYLNARSSEPWSPVLADPSSIPTLFRPADREAATGADRVRPALWSDMARAAIALMDSHPRPLGVSGTGVGSLPELPGYAIRERLGGGASGEVYRAWDRDLQRAVALKFPRCRAERTESDRERFRREGQVLARLKHPGIVTVFEVGEAAGQPYIAMEFVAGQTLAQATLGQPQPTRRAAALCESLALAVQRAHEAGLIHRDLKPANILLERPSGRARRPLRPGGDPAGRSLDGTPRIIDFGLAKDLLSADDLTTDRDILGTPGYMAPEQARGRHAEVGPATDVYGLGAILYELLTGRPPYREESAYHTLLAVSLEPLVPPRKLRPGLPRDLETICLKCLEKEPRRRYASAAALADDLRLFREGFPITARPPGPVGLMLRWVHRQPMTAALIGLSAAVALALSLGGPALAVREARRRVITEELADLARRQEQRAEAELARANANFQLAREAVARMTDLLLAIPDHVNVAKQTTVLQTRLEAVASEFHDRFAELHSQDPLIEVDRVESQVRLAGLERRQGNRQGSLDHLAAARGTFERLEREGVLPPERRYYWAVALSELATALHEAGQSATAHEHLGQARSLLQDLTRRDPDRADWFELELRLQVLACRWEPDPSRAISQLQEALGRYRSYLDRHGLTEPLALGTLNCAQELAVWLEREGRDEEAVLAYQDVLARWRWLATETPDQSAYSGSWVRVASRLAEYLERLGRPGEALQVCDAVLEDRSTKARGALMGLASPVLDTLQFYRIELMMRLGQPGRAERACHDTMRYTRGSQAMLERALWLRAQALVRCGSPDLGAAIALDLLRSPNLPAPWLLRLAETLALAAREVGARTPPEPAASERLARAAVAGLDRAFASSELYRGQLLEELKVLDLTGLAEREDFRALLDRHQLPRP